ncbi:transcription initiation factor TFIID subunit 4-like [Eschrichtius robustus]|uniref:transcription initiation factor TFIID subunit 4-like n=1 Tax=Eschrichtius robustus TaxID=9764 RepID=UPI0035C158D8
MHHNHLIPSSQQPTGCPKPGDQNVREDKLSKAGYGVGGGEPSPPKLSAGRRGRLARRDRAPTDCARQEGRKEPLRGQGRSRPGLETDRAGGAADAASGSEPPRSAKSAARKTTRPPRAPSGRARPAQPANCRARHRRRAPSAKLAAGTGERAGRSLRSSNTALQVTRRARSANPPHAASPSRRTEERALPASRLWTMGRSSEPPAPARVYTWTSASTPAPGPSSQGPRTPPPPDPDPSMRGLRPSGGRGAHICKSYRLPGARAGSRRGLPPSRTCFHSLARLSHPWAAGR